MSKRVSFFPQRLRISNVTRVARAGQVPTAWQGMLAAHTTSARHTATAQAWEVECSQESDNLAVLGQGGLERGTKLDRHLHAPPEPEPCACKMVAGAM